METFIRVSQLIHSRISEGFVVIDAAFGHDDDVSQGPDVGPDLHDLRKLKLIGDDDGADVRVVEDKFKLFWRQRGIDGNIDCPQAYDGHVGNDPLRTILRDDCDPVAARDAQGSEAPGKSSDEAMVLNEADASVRSVDLMEEQRTLLTGETRGHFLKHLDDRREVLGDCHGTLKVRRWRRAVPRGLAGETLGTKSVQNTVEGGELQCAWKMNISISKEYRDLPAGLGVEGMGVVGQFTFQVLLERNSGSNLT